MGGWHAAIERTIDELELLWEDMMNTSPPVKFKDGLMPSRSVLTHFYRARNIARRVVLSCNDRTMRNLDSVSTGLR